MKPYTSIRKGSGKSFSYNNAIKVSAPLGTPSAQAAIAAPRIAQQRAAIGDRSTPITVVGSGEDDVYTAVPATGGWAENFGAVANRSIPGDGMWSAARNNTGDGDFMLCWRLTSGRSNNFASAAYCVWTATSGSQTELNVKTPTTSPTTIPSVLITNGDRIGLQRVGSTVTVVKQTGSTGAFAVVYTFPETSTARMYPGFLIYGAGSVRNPQLLGGSWNTDYATSKLVVDGNSIPAGNNQVTPWPTVLKSRVPFNVAGCVLSNLAVSGQTTAQMISDGVAQVDAVFDPVQNDALIMMEISNSIYYGATARQAVNEAAQYCRDRQRRGFRVVCTMIIDRKGLSFAGTDMTSTIDAANALILAEWNTFCSDLIDPRLVPLLQDSSNATYFDSFQTHPNDAALAGYIDQCVSVLTTAQPATAGAVA